MVASTPEQRHPAHGSRARRAMALALLLAVSLRAATAPLLPRALCLLRGHTGGVAAVAWSPDGGTLASGSWDGTVRLWRTRAALSAIAPAVRPLGVPLSGHSGGVVGLGFGPDSQALLSFGLDRSVRAWSTASGHPLGPPLALPEPVDSLAFSPGGTLLAYGRCARWEQTWCVQGEIVVLDLAKALDAGTFAALRAGMFTTLRAGADAAQPICPPLAGHEGIVESLAFGPDGRVLASGSWDTTVRLWDTATGAPIGPPLAGHTDIVTCLAFSPDGATLASGSADRTIRLWDVGAAIGSNRPAGPLASHPLGGHTDIVLSLAFHPDGVLLASGGYDGTVRLWDTSTGQATGPPLAGHSGAVTGVALGPDGTVLASGSGDGSIGLWSLPSHLFREAGANRQSEKP